MITEKEGDTKFFQHKNYDSKGSHMRNEGWNILSLRENPQMLEYFIESFSSIWKRRKFYADSMSASLNSNSPLPQWYLLLNAEGKTVGGAGLVISDFTARGDLWPWLSALFVCKEYRGHACGSLLIAHLKQEAARLGYRELFLGTDRIGYYERYGFQLIGEAQDFLGKSSRIYRSETLPIWEFLIYSAKMKHSPRTLSPFIEAGGVSAALLTDRGNVYTGVCIDTACSLGMCAERAAAAAMISAGECKVVKLVCLMPSGEPGLPCGACREFLMQLAQKNSRMEILVSHTELRTVTLGKLMPRWWGASRMTRSSISAD